MKRSAVGKAASAIPGIGNAVTAVTELVLTSAVMVRNSFGAVIVILLLLIGAGPIIHYGSLSLVYRFLAAIAQPISDNGGGMCNAFKAFADSRSTLHADIPDSCSFCILMN